MESPGRSPRCDTDAKGEAMALMAGKQGLIMGVANDRSLAWGIAKALSEHGAELAFTFQGEALGRRVRPLAESVGSDFVVEADVTSETSLDAVFAAVAERWERLDFLGHGLAFLGQAGLASQKLDPHPANFPRTSGISLY